MKSSMGPAICFDTTPLIWGVEGRARESQRHEIENTKFYIKHLADKNFQIMVPTPVLAEYFAGAGPDEMKEQQITSRGFQIPPFDIPAARLAAEIARTRDIKSIKSEFNVGSQLLKTDIQILAIAIQRKAAMIVTDDIRHFRCLAGGRIKVIEVPRKEELERRAEFDEFQHRPASISKKGESQRNFLDLFNDNSLESH